MDFVLNATKKTVDTEKIYDVAVIGGGFAGSTSAIYLKRYALDVVMVSPEIGGLIRDAHKVENYPGFPSITGMQLSQNLEKHIGELDIPLIKEKAGEIKDENGLFEIQTEFGKKIKAKYIVYALGTSRRRLKIPHEEEYYGKGVSYCFTCDGPFYKNKVVSMVGGGDAALTGALYLADIAKKVYLIHRRETFKAEPIWIEKAKNHPNIEFVLNESVEEIIGENAVEKLKLKNKTLETDGLFIEIGSMPNSFLIKDLAIEFDKRGFIKVGKNQQTSHERIFAAGDVTDASLHFEQLTTAVSEGAIAARGIFDIENKK